MEQLEQFFTCPYCWQTISILLEPDLTSQKIVEDCERCCHPIEFTYTTEGSEVIEFEIVKFQ